ncbi:hypothetical protein LSUE1_G008320 [Lachnellula suecica]|uniref:Uncharacterized protein n=1 Tax=Lachnellula suecica TaxID=602035 RepID=A0A8T9BXY5_9HELO|nr:hypothetical protein LSUE1_G008320 [Lachnellula suecica]
MTTTITVTGSTPPLTRKIEQLKPQYRPSRLEPRIALIIHRLLPILVLGSLLYVSFTSITLDSEFGYYGALALYAAHELAFFPGYFYTLRSFKLKESDTPEEWLNILTSGIKTWKKRKCHTCEFKDIRREKERFAIYLSGSRNGYSSHIHPTLLSGSNIEFLKTAYPVAVVAGTRFACALAPFESSTNGRFSEAVFFIGMLLCLSCSFVIGRQIAWYERLGGAARQIRDKCFSSDSEIGTGSPRQQLEWWIEAILKEETDSDAMAKQRMKIIITPILKTICCCPGLYAG